MTPTLANPAIAAPAALTPEHLTLHTIGGPRSWIPLDVSELWDFRELLYFLVWREVKVRYKQTALGVAWAVIQPVMLMVVFSVFFGRFGKMPSDGLPYPVFAYCGLLPWQLFAFAITEATASVVNNQRLITKVYFPRLMLPIAAVSVGLVDFAVSFIVLIGLMAYYGIAPTWSIWTLPLWTLLAIGTALAVGLWLAALNVRYRDVRYTLPFLTQLWLFATPVAYASTLVSATWRPLYALNPMVGVVEGFRWALLGRGAGAGSAGSVAISILAVVVLLTGGLLYFRRTERTFADLV